MFIICPYKIHINVWYLLYILKIEEKCLDQCSKHTDLILGAHLISNPEPFLKSGGFTPHSWGRWFGGKLL
jgi:hypothetical protein